MLKKFLSILLVFTIIFSCLTVFAEDDSSEDDSWLNDEQVEDVFEDVNVDDWFYEAVMTMNKYEIISGYGDGTFRPNESVSREEFAVMMVKALKLELITPLSSFADIAEGYWALPYIETARSYITGYKAQDEVYYYPKRDAVREDMAVALVKALKKPITNLDSVLDSYSDKGNISKNLYDYVESAVYHKLMIGSESDNEKLFKPLATLTRAEAAALLLSVVKEEKIVFDVEEKIVLGDNEFILNVEVIEGGVSLKWDFNTDDSVSGYKVVASKSNEAPIYPVDGYAKYVQGNSTILYNGNSYNGGDFSQFTSNEEYYFAITALVGDEKISSNVVKVKMPDAISVDGKKPEVRVSQAGEGVLIEWNEINQIGLKGYKVVASKNDSTPIYPDNGYAKFITNLSTNSYLVMPYASYSNGDFGGKFKPGETYHFSITAVYDSGKIAGNTVTYIMPGEAEEEVDDVSNGNKVPNVSVTTNNDSILVKWDPISTDGLKGYKVVASKSNPNPVYSQDGYAYWITDLSVLEKELSKGVKYNGGDIDGIFVGGQKYYVSVTAVYSDQKIPGNAVLITMPE